MSQEIKRMIPHIFGDHELCKIQNVALSRRLVQFSSIQIKMNSHLSRGGAGSARWIRSKSFKLWFGIGLFNQHFGVFGNKGILLGVVCSVTEYEYLEMMKLEEKEYPIN